jgi:hypothetical protein
VVRGVETVEARGFCGRAGRIQHQGVARPKGAGVKGDLSAVEAAQGRIGHGLVARLEGDHRPVRVEAGTLYLEYPAQTWGRLQVAGIEHRVFREPGRDDRLAPVGAGLAACVAGAGGAALARAGRQADGKGAVEAALQLRTGFRAEVGEGQGEQGAGRGEPAHAHPCGDQQALAESLAGFRLELGLEPGEAGRRGLGRGSGGGFGAEAVSGVGKGEAQAAEARLQQAQGVGLAPAAADELVEGFGQGGHRAEADFDPFGAPFVAPMADPCRQARDLQQLAQALKGTDVVGGGWVMTGQPDPAVVLDAGEGLIHPGEAGRHAIDDPPQGARLGLAGEDAWQEGEQALAAHPGVSHRHPRCAAWVCAEWPVRGGRWWPRRPRCRALPPARLGCG